MGIKEMIEKQKMKASLKMLDGENYTSLKIVFKVEKNIVMAHCRDVRSDNEVKIGFLLNTVYSLSDLIKAMINKKAELDQQGDNNG